VTGEPVIAAPPQGVPVPERNAHAAYLLRHGDDNLILAQRLGEWISRGPDLEQDIAIGNFALDHLGQARSLLTRAAELEGEGRTEDDLAFLRSEREFTNLLMVEQPNGDFASTMVRQLFIDAYQVPLWEALTVSADETLAGVAGKAIKEARYHLRHSTAWVVRLGDGTEESHRRTQDAVDALWRFTGELFAVDDVDRDMVEAGIGTDPSAIRPIWDATVDAVLAEATLNRPEDGYERHGGRSGFHTDHLGHLLPEMQWMHRTYPGLEW